jgi:hypothetical protein
MFYSSGRNDRPASWRMPNAKQIAKLARERGRAQPSAELPPNAPPPAEWWDSVLSDPRAAGKSWISIQQRRLSEIPRELLRVECLRCFRAVEIQRLDPIRLYGPHAIYKDVARRCSMTAAWRHSIADDICGLVEEGYGRIEDDLIALFLASLAEALSGVTS